MQYLNVIISVTRFHCITYDKAIKYDHHDKRMWQTTLMCQITNPRLQFESNKPKSHFRQCLMIPYFRNWNLMNWKWQFCRLSRTFHQISWYFVHNHSPNISQLTNCCKVPRRSTKDTCILNSVFTPFLIEDITSAMKDQPFSIWIDGSNDKELERMNAITVEIYKVRSGKIVNLFLEMCEVIRPQI